MNNKLKYMNGPFTMRRVVWSQGHDSLENRLHESGFPAYDTPVVVPLGHEVYDIAVSHTQVNRFDGKFQRLEPFSSVDPLVKKDGKLSAIRNTIKMYEEQLGDKVWPGTEEWFKEQVSAFRTHESGISCGMIMASPPDIFIAGFL